MRKVLPTLVLIALGACGGDAPTVRPPDPTCPSVSLPRGDVRTFAGPSAVACIGVATASEAQEYLFVAANAKRAAGDMWTYQVGSALGQGSASSTQVPSSYRSESSARLELAAALEDGLRRNEQRLLGGRSIGALTRDGALSSSLPHSGASAARVAAVRPIVGDVMSYRVGDAASSDFCSNYTNVQAVVKAVGSRAVIVQDVTAPRGFTDEDFRAIAAEFDAVIYPVDAQWFGHATDINADQRITILYTPAINRLQAPGALGFVGGFFFLSDLLARSIPAQQWRCDASNEQEIIYLLTPDPDGQINGNRHSIPSALESTRGTLAHELQHMINQGIRQTVTHTDHLEVTWLNEGLSHFAEEAVGRAVRGYGDLRPLDWNDVLADLDDFDSFFRQNLLRLRSWMERPDLASPISQTAATLAPRGAAWALVRYSIDQYSRGDPKAFVRALVAGPEVDIQNLEARARVPFDEILPGYLIANFGGAAASGTAPRFTFTSWNMNDVMVQLSGGVHPLRVTSLPAQAAAQSPSGSGSYFTLSQPASTSAATFRMRSASGGAVEASDARVYVLRVK